MVRRSPARAPPPRLNISWRSNPIILGAVHLYVHLFESSAATYVTDFEVARTIACIPAEASGLSGTIHR
jgi:hypothetical protein